MDDGINWTKVAAIAGGVSAAAAGLTAIAHFLGWLKKRPSAKLSSDSVDNNPPVTIGTLRRVLESANPLESPDAMRPYVDRPILIHGQLRNVVRFDRGGGYLYVRAYDYPALDITVHFEKAFEVDLAQYETGSRIELLAYILPSETPVTMMPNVMNFHLPKIRRSPV